MTADEEFFQQALDRNDGDSGARLLLAEYLTERGDERAVGCRWLAQRGIKPQDYRASATWDWNDSLHFENIDGSIPHDIYVHLDGGRRSMIGSFREYLSRREAEEAFCAALPRHLRGDPPPALPESERFGVDPPE